MSTHLEINGENLLPIKDAAKLVSYSRDYVARLAREQKIVASQIGRQWFVDLVSLKSFAEASELEQAIRSKHLSAERKREQLAKQEIVSAKLKTRSKVKIVHHESRLVATMVLLFGLLSGAGIYTATTLFSLQNLSVARVGSASNFSSTAVTPSAKDDVSIFTVAKPQTTTMFNSVVQQPIFSDESEVRSMTSKDSEGILLLSRDGEVRDLFEVKAMFSDDVEVRFYQDGTGVVSYTQENGEVKEFTFVSVPVNKNSETLSGERI